eukprot:Protomagalhaensia_sp_Gyna_25__2300@NODE_225_length_4292_cov_27_445803_g175_i0_p1_GENE_NODE_225_length_4292_cov_27_445803_g175_i0NODE_225_length_4292_cov_27_445803_g175_i0_p1_ORF_typecomplete_len895_score141_88FAD_binding_4/PF01565_23/1_1e32Integrin_beta/PF00362_18/2_7e23BBE/PF08031_12/2_2e14VWA/PF00092_28/0_0012Cytokinbind/PF09265_10/0_12ALO/PF04030_14/0_25_NODE_225_length_4292_cov_27_445803_g175_i01922876
MLMRSLLLAFVAAATCPLSGRRPVQLAILQDATQSMDEVCYSLFTHAAAKIVSTVSSGNPGSTWGAMSFRDKPIWPLGDLENEDYCARLETEGGFISNLTVLEDFFGRVMPSGGADPKEGQFYAIARAAASGEFAWRSDAEKLILLITDAPPHFPGDGHTEDFDFTAFTGNFDLDDDTDCLAENYPTAEQVREILRRQNIHIGFLIIDRERALDAWTWFNEFIEQDEAMVQEISATGVDVGHRFLPIYSVVKAASCIQIPTLTLPTLTLPTLALPNITLPNIGLPTLLPPANSGNATESPPNTLVVTMPIVQYPTPSGMVGEPATTVGLSESPTRPHVGGFPGHGTAITTTPAVGMASSTKPPETTTTDNGFLSKRTTTTPVGITTSFLTDEEECTITETETTVATIDQQAAAQLYACLFSAMPVAHVVTPAAVEYALHTIPYNRERPTVSPAAIVFPNSTAEVQNAVRCVRSTGFRAMPRSGSHCYASFSFGTNGDVVIDVASINGIIVDQDKELAVIGPGARLGNVWYTLFNSGGFMLPLGACTSVGIAGHVLGGGYGFYSRAFGLGSDYIVRMEVVLADGNAVNATYEGEYSDLFWALRGSGNGNFGIVTSFEFQLLRAPETYTSATITWIGDVHKEVMNAVVKWSDHAAPGISLSLAAIGNQTLLQSAYAGTLDQFWAALNPLLDMIPFEAVPFVRQSNWLESAAELSIEHMNDAGEPVGMPAVRKVPSLASLSGPNLPIRARFRPHSAFFSLDNPLNETGVETLHRVMMDGPAEYAHTLELFGGPESRINVDVDSSFPHRNTQFIFHMYVRSLEAVDLLPHFDYATQAYYDRVKPMAAHGIYANYRDYTLGEEGVSHYYTTNLERLRKIKKKYDPNEVFRFPQSIKPAE